MVHVASSEHGQAEVADDERRALETGLARRATAGGIVEQHLGRHLPGRHIPGGYTWDLALDGDDRAAAAQLGRLLGPGGWPPGVVSVDAVLVEPVDGAGRWTHVWEQGYRDLDGLLHDYMESPFHWGVVDQWFYVGGPTRILKPCFAHVHCRSPRSVLAWS
jgi:hypothetical protein